VGIPDWPNSLSDAALRARLPRLGVGRVAIMSTAADAASGPPPRPLSGGSPRAIRAALLPEEVGDFDREFRREMATATETLDLSGVTAMLARWQRVALSSSQDPQAHRRMLAHAATLAVGGQVSRVPWDQTKARLGL
jgi:hypothetical protein